MLLGLCTSRHLLILCFWLFLHARQVFLSSIKLHLNNFVGFLPLNPFLILDILSIRLKYSVGYTASHGDLYLQSQHLGGRGQVGFL